MRGAARALIGLAMALWATGLAASPLADQMTAQLAAGQWDKARESAKSLLLVAGIAADPSEEALAHYGLGECAAVAGEWAEGYDRYGRAVALSRRLRDTKGVAYCSYMQGLCATRLSRFADARDALRAAIEAYGDTNAAMSGKAALNLCHALTQLGDLPGAKAAGEDAQRRLAGTDLTREQVQALYELGIVAGAAGRSADSRAYYEQGLARARELRLDDQVATGLNNLASLAEDEGRLADSESALREAVAIAEKLPGQPLLQGYLGNLARVTAALGRSDEALALMQRAIRLATDDGDEGSVATHLTTLTLMLVELGQYDDALAAADRAEAIRRAQKDDIGLSATLANRAMALSARGQLGEALAIYLQVAQVYEKLGLREPLATAYNNIGRIYDTQGDLNSALAYFERSITLATELQRPSIGALALSNTGLALYNALRPALPLDVNDHSPEAEDIRALLAKSREAFTQAAGHLRATGRIGWAATALNNVGQIDADLGHLEDAAKTLLESYDLHAQAHQPLGQCQCLANLGLLSARLGHLDEADRQLAQAAEQAAALGDIELQAAVALNMALLARQRGRLDAAIEAATRAVTLTEQRRALVGGGEEQQRQFLAGNIHPYLLLIELLIAAKRPAEAFDVAERGKARAMLDMMAGGKVSLYDRLPREETASLRQMESTVAARQVALSRLATSQRVDDAALADARQALATARSALSAEETRLAAMHPETTTTGTQPLRLAEAAARLPRDTALLEYSVGISTQYLFCLWRGDDGQPALEVLSLPAGDGSLADLVGRFRSACANPRRKWRQLGAEVYQRVLAGAVDKLPERITRLAIVAEGPLLDCPFGALVDEAHSRLVIDRYEVVQAASASLLAACLTLGEERRAKPASQATLIVADPDFGADGADGAQRGGTDGAQPGGADGAQRGGQAVAQRDMREQKLAPLPGTRAEAEAVAGLMPNPSERLGAAAQERTIKAEMGKYRWLHFATHGLLDADQPLHSAVALARPDQPGEDGFLEARELAQMNLNAELVTLSACQSGRGEAQMGEGLIGLPWAFVAARVPSQVVSLWSVDDRMTQELMTRFYRGLAAGKPKAAALRAAALDLRGSQITLDGGGTLMPDHPFYWAPFVLLGDWR